MADGLTLFRQQQQGKTRRFWSDLLDGLQNADALLPAGTSKGHKVLAYTYFVALARIAAEALDERRADAVADTAVDSAATATGGEPRPAADAASIASLEQSNPVDDRVRVDHAILATDAALESARHDLLTLPLSFLTLPADTTTDAQIKSVMLREVKAILDRLEADLDQALQTAIRLTQEEPVARG